MNENEISVERDVLLDIYKLNNGHRWKSNWNSDEPVKKWRGVKVSRNRIVELDLSDLGLRNLPSSIGQLTGLKELNLCCNKLRKLPAEIGKLSELRYLDLFANLFQTLPEELVQLQKLRVLVLSANKWKDIPELGKLKSLVNLHCSYLRRGFNDSVFQKLCTIKSLKTLHLGGNNLTTLPEQMKQLTNLTVLSVRDNPFTVFPAVIVELKKLEELVIGKSGIKLGDAGIIKLPESITDLQKLKKLHLYGNNLTEFPKEICLLVNLVELCLEDNQISELPPEIGNLTKLKTLSLYGNKFTKFPEEVRTLKNLVTFYYSGFICPDDFNKEICERVNFSIPF